MRGAGVDSLRFSPDGVHLIAGNNAGVGLWRTGGIPEERIALPRASYGSAGQRALALAPVGIRVAHATRTGWPSCSTRVFLEDLETSATLAIRECDPHQARTLAWSPDRKWLALAMTTGFVEIHDANQVVDQGRFGPPVEELPTGNAFALAFSPQGRFLATGAMNGRIEIWETRTWRKRQTRIGHLLGITDMAFSPDPDDPLLATTSSDGSVRLWSLEDKEDDLLALGGMPDGWDPDWETCILLDREGHYRIRPFGGLSPGIRYSLPYVTNCVTAAVGPRAQLAAFALKDRTVHLWDQGGQRRKERWSLSTRVPVDRLHFSPNGRVLFGLQEGGGTMWMWDVAEGREIASRTNTWSNTLFYFPQFTTDQRQVAIPYDDEGRVGLWDFAGSGDILLFEGRHPGCCNVALSPDGSTMASVSYRGTIQLWDVQSRQQTVAFEGRGLSLIAVTFTPEGQRLITGGEREIKVWDIATQRELGELGGAAHDGWSFRFRDPGTLLALTTEGVLRFYSPPFSEIEAQDER